MASLHNKSPSVCLFCIQRIDTHSLVNQATRISGQLKHGIYHNNIHPLHSNTNDFDEAVQIGRDQQKHVRHAGIAVPYHNSPFSDPKVAKAFFQGLGEVIEHNIEPIGYGMPSDEWEGGYPESIPAKQRGKRIQVYFTDPIWKCRATLWVQALHVMHCFQM